MPWKTRLIRAVVGILKREDKILVAQRPLGKPYSGYWEFPGGKVEADESSCDALKRELHEELGIDVLSARSWFQHTHTYPDRTVLLDMWLIERFEGEPHGKENQLLRWATIAEIETLRVLEGNIFIIEKIKTLTR